MFVGSVPMLSMTKYRSEADAKSIWKDESN